MIGEKPSFLFLGNDECLDFINTEIVERGRRTDLLKGFEELVRWLSEMDYIDPGTGAKMLENKDTELETELKRVIDFRSHLRRTIETVASGRPLLHSHLNPLNDVLSKQASYRKLILINSDPRLISYGAADELDPLAPVASAAAVLLTEKDMTLVKKCEGRGCELYFYDESKNHARRWCSMNRCGNRMKAALHYKKKKGGASADSVL